MPTNEQQLRATAIDELEISVKTTAFLQGLGVSTLGDLLDLPKIEAPKLVATEILALFDELEVPYDGEVVAKAKAAAKKVSGSVADRMRVIEAWLDENKPHLLETFAPPATDEAVTTAEKKLGVQLPKEWVELLRLHDGQEPGAPMIATCSLLPLEEVASEHAHLVDLFRDAGPVDESAVDAGIKKLAFSAGWIPIGRSARGRDILCLDLDPDRGGKVGQIVLVAVDDDARNLVATSVSDLLGQYFEAAQNGELEEDEDEDDGEEDEDLDDDDTDEEDEN
jgi:cell wall assembly regulator SMI1